MLCRELCSVRCITVLRVSSGLSCFRDGGLSVLQVCGRVAPRRLPIPKGT